MLNFWRAFKRAMREENPGFHMLGECANPGMLSNGFDLQYTAVWHFRIRVLKEWIDQNAKGDPILATGDFNADKNSSAYRQLTENGLFDVYKIAHPSDNNPGTFHGYGQVSDPIDWVLASDHFEVINSDVDRYHDGKRFPSDHYPVTATLSWKG